MLRDHEGSRKIQKEQIRTQLFFINSAQPWKQGLSSEPTCSLHNDSLMADGGEMGLGKHFLEKNGHQLLAYNKTQIPLQNGKCVGKMGSL